MIYTSLKEVKPIFLNFLGHIRALCGIGDDFSWKGAEIETEEDPHDPANHEAVMRSAWSQISRYWAGVESTSNYVATIATLIDKLSECRMPQQGKLQVLSLGTGPGVYELFLAWWLKANKMPARIHSTDYAEDMITLQREILESPIRIGKTKVSALRDIVSPSVADMSALPDRFSGKADVVICNNSLQWVAEWRQAVGEIAQAVNPKGRNRMVYFIVHPHAMRVQLGDRTITRDHVEVDALLDEMEKHNLQPLGKRFMIGPPGSGQAGNMLNRMLISAQLMPQGIEHSWRSMRSVPGKVTVA